MRARGVVWGAAVAAALLRFPGLVWPIRPDEAGFTLVARTWDAQPDSLYGFFWVDRPPSLIALVRLSDWLGGPLFLRLVAAVGCCALVLAAAGTARAVTRVVGRGVAGSESQPDRVAAWCAVLAAALVGNVDIDPAAAKGEILGIPLVMVSIWLTLRALERHSTWTAFWAGLAAAGAVGLKQSMVTGLVFGAVLLVGLLVARRLGAAEFGRLAAAAALGAAVPVAATIGWALVAGVHLDTLAYTVFGFRSDAGRVIATVPSQDNDRRFVELLLITLFTGMALVVAWFLLNLPALLRRAPVLTVAAGVTLVADVGAVLLGGSFWRPYAFALVPGVVLCHAVTLAVTRRPAGEAVRPDGRWRGLVGRGLVVAAAGSTAVTAALFLAKADFAVTAPKEYWTGEAIAGAAEPEDSLVVYGGRADLQWASGLPTPYQHLWSLPMRTLDPELAELRGVLAGPERPTWFVAWAPLGSWQGLAERELSRVLAQRYAVHDEVCGRIVWIRRDLTRPDLTVDCERLPF